VSKGNQSDFNFSFLFATQDKPFKIFGVFDVGKTGSVSHMGILRCNIPCGELSFSRALVL
jgi:hypothetical protein